MGLLSQNNKMRKSSHSDIEVFNFGIPAFMSQDGTKTCPNAKACVSGCYARSGTYRFRNVVNAYENRLKLSQSPDFVPIMDAEIKLAHIKTKAKNKTCLIRIHDSGDFYSKKYAEDWYLIMRQNPDVLFYAYTKMISMMSQFEPLPNFRLIYSLGGTEDSQIDTAKHYHSKVFESLDLLIASGYSDASSDDLVAALGPNPKIGLVYHGQKKYSNTTWGKVS